MNENVVFILIFFGFLFVFFVMIAAVTEGRKKAKNAQNGEKVVLDGLSQTEKPQKSKIKKKGGQEKIIEEHEHLGEEEHYEKIVGSLGEVNDEGCQELNGVRLISHDIAYDPDDETSGVDLKKVGRAMVLGEVLNDPVYKKY